MKNLKMFFLLIAIAILSSGGTIFAKTISSNDANNRRGDPAVSTSSEVATIVETAESIPPRIVPNILIANSTRTAKLINDVRGAPVISSSIQVETTDKARLSGNNEEVEQANAGKIRTSNSSTVENFKDYAPPDRTV